MLIYHITTEKEFLPSLEFGEYRSSNFSSDGFIHCSKSNQLETVIKRYFMDFQEILLVQIDPEKLAARVVYENLEGGTDLYPHIYDPINLEAILKTFLVKNSKPEGFKLPREVLSPV